VQEQWPFYAEFDGTADNTFDTLPQEVSGAGWIATGRMSKPENRGPLSAEAVAIVFRQIMSACLALEQPLRVAYLGQPGTYSHDAVGKHFGALVSAEPCATIDEVFAAVISNF
jgi:hypothetical protein